MNIFKIVRAYIGVARLEYLPAEAPGLVIPLLLGAAAFTDLLRLEVFEGVAAFSLLFISGFLVNSLTDIEVDMKYKTHVSSSVAVFGKKGLAILLVGHLLAALLLSIHIAFLINDWMVVLLVLVGIFFGIGYSLKPFHFKVRGPGHVVALALSAFFIPGTFLYYCIAGMPDLAVFIILFGFSILHYGIALANQSGDYYEDGDAGLKTPAVRWGLGNTLLFGIALNVIGISIMISGIFVKLLLLDTTVPLMMLFAVIVVPAILMIGYYTPIKGMMDLYKISKIEPSELGDEPEYQRSCLIKKRMNYPKWQASGVYSTFLVVIGVFLIAVLFQHGSALDNTELGPEMVDYSSVRLRNLDIGNELDEGGNLQISAWVDINNTHDPSQLFVSCESYFGSETLYNSTFCINDIRTSDLSEEDVRFGIAAASHRYNDTGYVLKLFRVADGKTDLLDSQVIEPEMEIFATNISHIVKKGVIRNTLFVDVLVYNRLVDRGEGSITITITGNFQVPLDSVSNNETISAEAYWQAPQLRIDVPKTPGSYDVVITYNGEQQDTHILNIV